MVSSVLDRTASQHISHFDKELPYVICDQHKPRSACTYLLSDQSAQFANRILRALGLVVQSIVSLTSLLRVISLTILADSIHNILKFFAEKM